MATLPRADHVGSFLRPPELFEARHTFNEGKLTREQLTAVEDAAVLKVLELQRQVGLEIFSDGEYRRNLYSGAFDESFEGLAANPDVMPNQGIAWQGPNVEDVNAAIQEVRPHQLIVASKLEQKRRLAGHEAAFLREHAPGPWKITLTPPNARQGWKAGITDLHYDMVEDLQAEMIEAYQNEIRQLAAEGCSYVQLDSLAYVIQLRGAGNQAGIANVNPQLVLDNAIAVDNALAGTAKAADVTVALHMCRGNNRSAWIAEGSYEPVAERAFNMLNVDRFLLEYDTERAGGFEPLRFMPKGKSVALGLISTKTPALESQDDLMRRIEEAAKYISIEDLALTPQCGFASIYYGNNLSWDDQRRKLELLVETSQRV
jgi:5-methyltetrahydropteroyltriglutamate--homocysteine methyltransferase